MWEEKVQYTGDDLDGILGYLTLEGFNDVYITTGRPIIYKMDGIHHKLGERSLQDQEVRSFVTKVTGDPQAASELMSTTREIDRAYSVTVRRDGVLEKARFRVAIVKARDGRGFSGPSITMRSISSDPVPLEKQMVEPELLEAFKSVQVGMVVIAGATGSGKSTLIAGFNKHRIEKEGANEVLLEASAPIEYVYDNCDFGNCVISQQEVAIFGGDTTSFAEFVRAALRRAPTIIVVGESRDRETFDAGMKAANTGHLTVTTMHVNSVADIPSRVISEFPESREARLFDFCMASRIWIVQRLVARKGGGRVPIREYLILTQEIINELSITPAHEIRGYTRKMIEEHGQTMEASAQQRYDEGLITIETLKSNLG